jgi:hypothetical protein
MRKRQPILTLDCFRDSDKIALSGGISLSVERAEILDTISNGGNVYSKEKQE